MNRKLLKEGKFPIRFGHWIIYNSLVTPHTCYCYHCKKSWNNLQDVPNEECPAKPDSKYSVNK